MLVPGSVNPLLAFTSAAAGYQISRSLRFNSSDSASCARTFTSSGNRRTWTLSLWVKRSAIAFSAEQHIWGVTGATDATYGEMFFGTGDTLRFAVGYTTTYGITTTRVFRDPSAWYHIVLAFDATQSTATNKIKLYINGVEETTFSSDTRSSLANQDWGYNNNVAHYIGRNPNSDIRQFNGYLADVHFIDGQALTPSSFGQTDANGEWQPIQYTGTYGTNGFKLNFADNSAATAAALGKDTSGNSNNWTPNNLSVTAGAGNDSLVDTPTSYGTDTGVGSEVRGNYCTLNPLDFTTVGTLSNGNLDFAQTSAAAAAGRATIGINSGKWYWEYTVNTSGFASPGIGRASMSLSTYAGGDANGWSYGQNGTKYNSGSSSAYGAAYVNGDVIGIAYDADAGSLTFYRNGASQGVAYSGLTGTMFPAFSTSAGGSNGFSVNFGQRPFAYTAPSGFKALCDTNLPAPVVAKPSTVMDVKLYTGNGGTQTISGLGFSPDLVWIKNRTDASTNNSLWDAIRGAGTSVSASNRLSTDNTSSEWTSGDQYGYLSALNSDGFTVVKGTALPDNVNNTSKAYVAWCWDAGSSNVVNTQGSITSTVRANPSAGFSIVSYTVGASASTVGHGLNVAPQLLITKNRSAAGNWAIYHASSGAGNYFEFSTQGAIASSGPYNGTAPTSSVFTIGASSWWAAGNLITYAFAPVAGYTSAGSYTGNGSADGPFVYTSMRPRWILLKRTDSTGNWTILDTAREGYNVDNDPLYPNLADAEGTTDLADILSNGFKLRSTDASVNASAGTYIYFAISEAAFQYARAR